MNHESLLLLLENSWEKFSDNDALQVNADRYSYQRLFSAAKAIADQIQVLAPEANSILVYSKKSFIGYANILSCFFAQKTYIPVNYGFPVAKNCEVIQQSLAITMIVDPSCIEELTPILDHHESALNILLVDVIEQDFDTSLWSQHNFFFLKSEFKDNTQAANNTKTMQKNPAYLLFTSGSTGRPKGVPISEKNLLSYLDNIHQLFDFNESDRFSQFFEFTFDLSIHDLFVCWSCGACLVAANEFAKLMPLHFAQRNELTIWFSVPSLVSSAQTILKHKFNEMQIPTLRHSLFCGEALPSSLAKDWHQINPQSTIDNLYGPTEATIAFTHYLWNPLQPSESPVVPIGKAFGGNKTYILDESLKPVSKGQQGQLFLAGPQLAAEYWQNPENTNTSFKTIAVDGKTEMIYQSGDLVSEISSGQINYHGRVDHQVQLRGYRVELQEVEHVIRQLTATNQVAVIAYPLSNEGEALGLVAFYTSSRIDTNQLQLEIAAKLPDYMVPAEFLFEEDLPVNSNGKIDRIELQKRAQAHHTLANTA